MPPRNPAFNQNPSQSHFRQALGSKRLAAITSPCQACNLGASAGAPENHPRPFASSRTTYARVFLRTNLQPHQFLSPTSSLDSVGSGISAQVELIVRGPGLQKGQYCHQHAPIQEFTRLGSSSGISVEVSLKLESYGISMNIIMNHWWFSQPDIQLFGQATSIFAIQSSLCTSWHRGG